MKTTSITYQYVAWLNADQMHKASRNWISELNFIKDEHQFLEELVQSYTMGLISKEVFKKNQTLVSKLSDSRKKVITLLKTVQTHENQLEVMVDGVDQPDLEEKYREIHRNLIITINQYQISYRKLKQEFFETIAAIMKKSKQKKLLSGQ